MAGNLEEAIGDERMKEGFIWPKFTVKDSGKRAAYESGMVRDTTEDKISYDLIFDGPMVKRWADHLTKGALKYEKRNWMKASSWREAERFRESAIRHFCQWVNGDEDEDHASATLFNINALEYMKERWGKNVWHSALDVKEEKVYTGADACTVTSLGMHTD